MKMFSYICYKTTSHSTHTGNTTIVHSYENATKITIETNAHYAFEPLRLFQWHFQGMYVIQSLSQQGLSSGSDYVIRGTPAAQRSLEQLTLILRSLENYPILRNVVLPCMYQSSEELAFHLCLERK